MPNIIDAEGNERPIAVGYLVQQKGNPYRLGRVTRWWIDGFGDWCDLECRITGHSYTCKVEGVTLISGEFANDTKEPGLQTRYNRLRKNLDDAISTCSYHDGQLLHRLRLLFWQDIADEQHTWFWRSVTESLDNPQQVSYASKIEWIDNDTRRMRCSISKFLRKAGRAHGADFTDEEANRIGELFGTLLPSDYEYKFDVVSGEGVRDAYYEDHARFGSCMHQKPYVNWYVWNPDAVELVRILQGNKMVGRALLWNTTSGKKVLDRVYPSDCGPQMTAVHTLAKEQGWDYKKGQNYHDGQLASGSLSYVVKMKVSSSGDYPYCDTFKYTDDDPENDDIIHLNLESGDYTFNSTDGGYEGGRSRITCCECGCRVDEDYANYDGDNCYCDACHGQYFRYLDYRLPSGRYVEGSHHRDDVCECEHCGEYRRNLDFTEVEDQEVCTLCAAADAVCCQQCSADIWTDNSCELSNGDTLCSDCYKKLELTECDKCHGECETEQIVEQDEKRICPTCLEVTTPVVAPAAETQELWRCSAANCVHCQPAGSMVYRRAREGCPCSHCKPHWDNIQRSVLSSNYPLLPLYGERLERQMAIQAAAAAPVAETPIEQSETYQATRAILTAAPRPSRPELLWVCAAHDCSVCRQAHAFNVERLDQYEARLAEWEAAQSAPVYPEWHTTPTPADNVMNGLLLLQNGNTIERVTASLL